MKQSILKKIGILLSVILILSTFSLFAMGSGESEDNENQGTGEANEEQNENNLGKYNVVISSCRLSTDWEGKPIVIVKYIFTNNDDEPTAFYMMEANVYQNGVGLNECIFVSDDANYSSDNQSKEIKKGATIEVEIAYNLNDTTTDIEVEVSRLISFSDKKVTKTFKITK